MVTNILILIEIKTMQAGLSLLTLTIRHIINLHVQLKDLSSDALCYFEG